MRRLKLEPVKQRVRLSARISRSFHQDLRQEISRRRRNGKPGGHSLAEATSVAFMELADAYSEDPRSLHKAYWRASHLWMNGPSEVHLQPRVPSFIDEVLREAVPAVRDGYASRRTLTITALHVFVEGPPR
jgi:hypothetical protein